MSDFGTYIKNLRKDRRITQRDLADRINVDFTYISKIESGKEGYIPSVTTIGKIAEVLDVDADELILLANKVPDTIRDTIVDDDLAAAFLRKVPRLSSEQRDKVKSILDEV